MCNLPPIFVVIRKIVLSDSIRSVLSKFKYNYARQPYLYLERSSQSILKYKPKIP